MRSPDVFRGYGESLEKLLRLKTYSLAIKLLEKEEDIPEGAKRPRKDYGYRMLACQAFSESRRAGATIVQTKMETWCSEGAVGYGFIEPIEYFLEGNTRFLEGIVSTREAAKFWAHEFPRLEYGKYAAIVSAPLVEVNFEPDLVMLYGNSAQIAQLLSARTWIDGYDITCRMSAQGACVHAVVPVIQTGECQVTFPCVGDRRRAFAQDDEVIFSAPIEKVESLIAGLTTFNKRGAGFPVVPKMEREPEMLKSYMEMARLTGMIE
ncbi:DUF169 domain-containing protein [Chloroflexota bacterium]